ncbi:uncharacterized protein [Watersipora subatra]|uniref:uncharacterized protein n=1 Tax=Watersipora subatra TaxID=2589382 RepID=UPI00355B0047
MVLTDHLTRWQDALTLLEAMVLVVASALDEWLFCYMSLPEQIHTDKIAQFESQLMTELCRLCQVDKTHTTHYHLQANGLVTRSATNPGVRRKEVHTTLWEKQVAINQEDQEKLLLFAPRDWVWLLNKRR